MFRVPRILIIAISIWLLAGCSVEGNASTENKDENDKTRFVVEDGSNLDNGGNIKIMIDVLTGCEYITSGTEFSRGGISPLLDSQGKPSGCHDIE